MVALPDPEVFPSVAVMMQKPGVVPAVYVAVTDDPSVAPVVPLGALMVPQVPDEVNVTVSLFAAPAATAVTAADKVEVATPFDASFGVPAVSATVFGGSVRSMIAVPV
jgi:hypothetical protein